MSSGTKLFETVAQRGRIDRRTGAYLVGYLLSAIGSFMLPVALTFSLIQTGHGAQAIGFVLAAGTAPMLLLTPFAGVVADRIGRRPVMIVCDLARGIAECGLVAALVLLGSLPVPVFAAFAGAMGVAQAFFMPASIGFVRELAPDGRLQTALSWQAAARSSARICGPALAGALVLGGSTDLVILLDALSFLCNAALLLGVVGAAGPGRSGRAGDLESISRPLLGLLRSNDWIRGLILFGGGFHLLVYAPNMTIGPLIMAASDHGAAGWGLIISGEGAGAVMASAVIGMIRPRRPLPLAIAAAGCSSVVLLALAWQAPLPLVLLAAATTGVSLVVFSVLKDTAIQGSIEPRLLSTVASIDLFVTYLALSAGYAVVPAIQACLDGNRILILSAVLCMAMSLFVLVRWRLRGGGADGSHPS